MDFQTLYKRYAREVYRFALYLCGNHADAEDITSETFVRAWNAQERIKLPTVKAYLLAIARNCYLKDLRRQSHHHALAELDQVAIDPMRGLQIAAEQKAELARVLSALQDLPETDRAALLLRAQEELSYQEIALTLGLSEAAVKTKIHRARLKLAHGRETPR